MDIVPSVSVFALRPVVEHLTRVGIPSGVYTERLGLSEATLADDDARIPIHKLVFMWKHALHVANDADIGLHAAESAGFDAFGAVSAIARVSPTIGEAFRRVKRYARFVAGIEVYDLVEEGGVAALRMVRPRWMPIDRQSNEFILALPHLYSRLASSRPWAPIEVTFAHSKPASTAEHARIFGCPVRFDARFAEIRFPAPLLASPLKGRDDRAEANFREIGERLLTRLGLEPDLVARVSARVLDRLIDGDVSLEVVARDLGMSERSLQRKLAEANTSHREVLDQVRSILAERLLDDSPNQGLPNMLDVALRLGFADQTAFQRAFRRWKGTSPGRWRRAFPLAPSAKIRAA